MPIICEKTDDGYRFTDTYGDVYGTMGSGHITWLSGDRVYLQSRYDRHWWMADLADDPYKVTQQWHRKAYGGANGHCVNFAGSSHYLATERGVKDASGEDIHLGVGQFRADYHQTPKRSEWHVWKKLAGEDRAIYNESCTDGFLFSSVHQGNAKENAWHELIRVDDWYYCRLSGLDTNPDKPWYMFRLDGTGWEVWSSRISHPAWNRSSYVYSNNGTNYFIYGNAWSIKEDGNHYHLQPDSLIMSVYDRRIKQDIRLEIRSTVDGALLWQRDADTYPEEQDDGGYDFYAMFRPCHTDALASWHYKDKSGRMCVQVARREPKEPDDCQQQLKYCRAENARLTRGIEEAIRLSDETTEHLKDLVPVF